MATAEPNKGNQTIQMQRKNDSGVYENYYPNTVMSQVEGSIQMKAKVNITANVGDNIAISGDSTQTVTIADSGTATIYLPYGDYTFTNNSNNFTVKLIVDTIKTYEVVVKVKTLEEYSWAEISRISQNGEAANKFSVGDTKSITLEGTILKGSYNITYCVYILDFNHDKSSSDGVKDGITFGTFKSIDSESVDIALVYNYDSSYSFPGFHMNTTETAEGGWKNCYMRYTILGSTNTQNDSATPTTATSPVSNTLMSCLPSDLREVMKPMYISSYTKTELLETLDYLPLLGTTEVKGSTFSLNTGQVQYAYYKNGNSTIKYQNKAVSKKAHWWLRDAAPLTIGFYFVNINKENTVESIDPRQLLGVAPMFKV